eukprot:gene1852-1345_t
MAFQLDFNTHGKGRVRLVKVTRRKCGTHEIMQLNVQILLEGNDMDSAFTEGDNSKVVPTDTCKNTVYCVANQHEFSSIEEFGLILGKHFVTTYPSIVNKVNIVIKKDTWERIVVPDSRGKNAPHKHTFKRIGPQMPFTEVSVGGNRGTVTTVSVKSGFKSLDIMKTTQSGFVGFPRCRFTSLPEATDRLLGTSADCEWVYNSQQVLRGSVNFNKVYSDVESALIKTFAGPADKGVYSASVQQTLHQMACAGLQVAPSIDEITLLMPNIHNMTFNLEQYGLKNKDHTGSPHIFYPIDEPHGMIKATVKRTQRARL